MNEITLTFTVGQLFAVVGAICLLAFTIALIYLIVQAGKTLKEVRKVTMGVDELVDHANEIVDDVRTSVSTAFAALGKVKTALNVAEKFKRKDEE